MPARFASRTRQRWTKCDVLEAMPTASVLQRRDQALVAFACLTGARASALLSFRIGHVNLAESFVVQDARVVRTKFAKTFRTDFHCLVPGAAKIIADWCAELKRDHIWGPDDPLFPQPEMGLDPNGGFAPVGLSRKGWATSETSSRDIQARIRSRRPSVSEPALSPRNDSASLHGSGVDTRSTEGGVAKPRPFRCSDELLRATANFQYTVKAS